MADKITSTIAKETDGNVQITFTIPFDIIKKAQDEALVEFAKDAEIPGFRKGKAPLDKVAAKVSQNALMEHSLGHILPKALAEAINEHKLKLAIYPKFELISAEVDRDWQIRGVTCELPEVELGDYQEKIKLIKDKKENDVIKALLETIKITIPKILIEEEVNGRLSNLLARIEKLGLALESYLTSVGKNVEVLRKEYEVQAQEAISLDLILSKIAEVEKLEVKKEEINEALKVSDAKDDEQRERLIESILKRRKALDFLINLK
ncbi:MAG TPA: trigger factor [Alphaproteobacteria bacterium]|jgi:FKBP-type peptidyl-prolyl cis-trans isomerase (trigger factor)|nr:trigger factor [Alphaproteobacteria bacterium]